MNKNKGNQKVSNNNSQKHQKGFGNKHWWYFKDKNRRK